MLSKHHFLYIFIGISLFIFYSYNKSEQSTANNLETHKQELLYSVDSNKSFTDAAEDAAFAISERNFRITNTLRIGNAIRERGTQSYLDYDVILFCNIQYAEYMIDEDPSYVNYCPGQITISEVSENQVIISAPLVPLHDSNDELNQIVQEINRLVIESVDFAAETWQQESE